MTVVELKNTFLLGAILATRMLGLFMILPILTLYVDKLPGATLGLLGIAAGAYGFTQALFQLPLGILSDYIGRKPVILLGLIVFALGSFVTFFTESIWGVVIGRAIQGAGAIGSPILAFVADITREEVRTRAMACLGMSIGLTFVLAIILGPLLDAALGLSGIFGVTGCLAITGMFLLLLVRPQMIVTKPKSFKTQFKALWIHDDLWRLNIMIFVLHAVFTANFLVLPLKVREIACFATQDVWKFYLSVLGLSLLLIMPFLRKADRWQKEGMRIAIIGLGVSTLFLLLANKISVLIIASIVFFMAFNWLEANLPALVSKVVPAGSKGAAMGVYSCSQFLGIFTGGALGGYLLQVSGEWGIGVSCLVFSMIGWISIQKLSYFSRNQFNTEVAIRE